MSRIGAFLYDRGMAKVEEACLRTWRNELIKRASGVVLEIGAGTGANVECYSSAVSSLILSEPDPHMRNRLQEKTPLCKASEVEVADWSAEAIEAENESFDFVVGTLFLCSVSDVSDVLNEIRRVLKPDGQFLFMEHVGAEQGTRRRRWQNWLTPIWKTINGNCHLNRETELAIKESGFRIVQIDRESMRKAMPIVRPTIRGIAVKA